MIISKVSPFVFAFGLTLLFYIFLRDYYPAGTQDVVCANQGIGCRVESIVNLQSMLLVFIGSLLLGYLLKYLVQRLSSK